MSQNEDGPDTSSIKPISSLRSKFESLGKDDHLRSPSVARSPLLPLSRQHTGSRPRTAGGDGTSAASGQATFNGQSPLVAPVTPISRTYRPNAPTSRPSSMVSMSPTRDRGNSPPLVTVDSPRSPRKLLSIDTQPPLGQLPSPRPLSPHPNNNGSGTHSRNISRAATPALEARAAAFLQSGESPSLQPEKNIPDLSLLASKPKSESSNPDIAKAAPPTVNRAAKPKIPAKPQLLANQNARLTTPEANADLTDRSVSPFSTPPSSGDSSPAPAKDPAANTQPPLSKPLSSAATQNRARNGSDPTAVRRLRTDSDASWVQRIRGDSDASMVDRDRAGSTASFVEPSSLPDDWQPPPVHHAVAARREQHSMGFKRAPTMPARYGAVPGRDDDLSDSVEDRPRLPARPELQMRPRRTSPPKARSGRTSPLKISHSLPPRRSADTLRSAPPLTDMEIPRIPGAKGKSALYQGFDASPKNLSASMGPTIPPARRSTDRRRDPPPPPVSTTAPSVVTSTSYNGYSRDDEEDPAPYGLNNENIAGPTDFPDATRANRRPPRFKQRPWHIATTYDTRLFAVCGDYVCTTGYYTKAWNLRTGEELLHLEHRENTRITSVVFKPSTKIENEGKRVWLGTNAGEILEVDIPSQSTVKVRADAHKRREVIRMFRYASELWTLDDGGELYVWKPDHKGMPSLDSQCVNWRVPKGHSYSIACGKQLWMATGRDIRVFLPGAHTDSEFQVLKHSLSHPGAGEVTSGATIDAKPDLVYFGHSDGKVSIYSRKDFTCKAVVNVSIYKIACLAGIGDYLWAGYSTGMAYVYDPSTEPWVVKKDWKAHEKPICGIIADPSAMWKMGRLNVITLGIDNHLRIWDGTLAADWLEARMQSRDSDYCAFHELTAAVLTWNAGASKPSWLSHHKGDSEFFRDYLTAREPADILVFGFQELVDLEDKKMTAKSLFKSKKKDPAEQEHMSRQYRAWRDHLTKCVDEYMPSEHTYMHLHTSSMVGLFTCVFVKSRLRPRIRHVHTSEVKRGMGGHHGNKGALVLRMVLDDSSICFINCHLAAGQTQTLHRNNDIAEILEAHALPSYPLNDGETAQHSDVFAAGGDGSMIMDHEICILNGDLNYRIDTMGRDAVIKQVAQGNLTKLLDRDQLLLSRKKNPGFRLRAFQESPITFAPTYKYNVGTDDYDTSEKRRAPAWCDRVLYRGLGRVKMEDYRRWDSIRVSDHRPVSGRLRLRVKTVDPDKREIVWDKCEKEFVDVERRIARAAQLEYLTNVLGMAHKEAVAALQGG